MIKELEMHIGLFFGSFNPIHHAHLIIANHILNEGLVDRIWFVVSPHNPHKESKSLLNENQRLHLVNIAIEGVQNIKASDLEFGLPRPSYTSVTLAHLVDKYPDTKFSIVMGGDSFKNLSKWKNTEYIQSNFEIIVYKRVGDVLTESVSNGVKFLDAPLMDISATHIRSLIKQRKSVKYLLPDAVISEIEKSGYYKK